MSQDFSQNTPRAPQSLPEVTLQQNIIEVDPTICVICLEIVSERAVALPCKHDCFDFPCLGNWLTKHTTCPLCKASVEKLDYEFNGAGESKIFYLPSPDPDEVSHSGPTHRSDQRRHSQRRIRRPSIAQDGWTSSDLQADLALERRRRVYRNHLLSLHVGTNRVSRYQELNPLCFRNDDGLISRARKWIRRELRVFNFLDLDRKDPGGEKRIANNAEFLLEYIIALLKTTDIKGSGGHAEDLLKDFLGRENTRLFLHELQAWLRSPYKNIEEWDQAVQYDESRRHPDSAGAWIESDKRTASASSSYSSPLRRLNSSQYYRYTPD